MADAGSLPARESASGDRRDSGSFVHPEIIALLDQLRRQS